MFKLYLAALTLMFMPLTVTAQENFLLAVMGDCASSRTVKQFIYVELQEVPFSGGWGIMQREDGEFVDGQWKIYASPDWATFSIAIEFPNDGIMCLVGLGDDLKPFQDHSQR